MACAGLCRFHFFRYKYIHITVQKGDGLSGGCQLYQGWTLPFVPERCDCIRVDAGQSPNHRRLFHERRVIYIKTRCVSPRTVSPISSEYPPHRRMAKALLMASCARLEGNTGRHFNAIRPACRSTGTGALMYQPDIREALEAVTPVSGVCERFGFRICLRQ